MEVRMSDGPDVKIDLSHAVNRIADSWFDLFTGDVKTDMPGLGCAYPGSLSESDQEVVRNHSTHNQYELRWAMAQKATDSNWETRQLFSSIGWDLHVNWVGLEFVHEGQQYHFIDQAHAYVALTDPSQTLTLYVKGMFAKPSFVSNNASLPVYFNVIVKDGSTTIRDEPRSFYIHGDGQRERFE
jgi:hypothetical protein